MATRQRTSKNSVLSGFLSFIQANWIFLIAFFFALPYAIKYINDLIAQMKGDKIGNEVSVSNAENGASSPVIAKKKVDLIKSKYKNLSAMDIEKCKTVAQKIAIALGTNVEDNHFVFNFDFYNVSALTEDESAVVKLLKTVPGTYPVVEELYFTVYTRSRNLKVDLIKYLSSSDLAEVRAVYKKYHVNWV